MPAEGRRSFLAMVAVINHYVQEATDKPDEKLPIEFESLGIELKPYTPQEILATISNIMRIFGSSGGTELTNQTFLQEMTKRHGADVAKRIFDDILPLNDPDAYTIVSNNSAAKLSTSNTKFEVGLLIPVGKPAPISMINTSYTIPLGLKRCI